MSKLHATPYTIMDAIFYRIVSHMINGAFQKHTTRPENTRNVVVFGSSGVGKTSLVNGLTGQNLEVGGGSRGVTFGCKHVPASYNGNDYDIIDTAGLNEAEGGTVRRSTIKRRRGKYVDIYRMLLFDSLITGE